jgi:predicted NBD/HSP70 family sugar kinase
MRRPAGTTRPERSKAAGPRLSGTNLERAGDYNQRVTLQAIRVVGPVIRPDLATITGLTPPAIANITKRLLDQKLIIEVGRVRGGRGQPGMQLAVNPDGCFSLGMNIDRDHITIVLLDFAGRVRSRATREIDFASPEAVAKFFQDETGRMFSGWDFSAMPVLGLGVAMPDDMGQVDLPRRPADYEAWSSVDVRALLAPAFDLPIIVENDAAAAALGESQFGHGLRKPSFFYILITSGLGGGLVIDGEHFRGANGRSGEIGFLPVRSRRSSARSLQGVVSLSALYDHLERGGFSLSHPEELSALPPDGQALLAEWVDLAAELLTEPVLNISCVVNPEAIYVGGRLPADIVDHLIHALNRRLSKVEGVPTIAPVLRAATAADAPAVGAAILPFISQLLPSRANLRKMGED